MEELDKWAAMREERLDTPGSAKQQAGKEDMLEKSSGGGYTEDGRVTNTESRGSSRSLLTGMRIPGLFPTIANSFSTVSQKPKEAGCSGNRLPADHQVPMQRVCQGRAGQDGKSSPQSSGQPGPPPKNSA